MTTYLVSTPIVIGTGAARSRRCSRLIETLARWFTPTDPNLCWGIGPDGLLALTYLPTE